MKNAAEEVGAKLLELIVQEPKEYNYARTRWTSEMLAEQLKEQLKIFFMHRQSGDCYPNWALNGIEQDPLYSFKIRKKHVK